MTQGDVNATKNKYAVGIGIILKVLVLKNFNQYPSLYIPHVMLLQDELRNLVPSLCTVQP